MNASSFFFLLLLLFLLRKMTSSTKVYAMARHWHMNSEAAVSPKRDYNQLLCCSLAPLCLWGCLLFGCIVYYISEQHNNCANGGHPVALSARLCVCVCVCLLQSIRDANAIKVNSNVILRSKATDKHKFRTSFVWFSFFRFWLSLMRYRLPCACTHNTNQQWTHCER